MARKSAKKETTKSTSGADGAPHIPTWLPPTLFVALTLALFREFDPPFVLGLGVIDVKTHEVESPDVVAERIRQALKLVAADKLAVNPDCGLVHLPRDVAFGKLGAMVAGTKTVRRELGAG